MINDITLNNMEIEYLILNERFNWYINALLTLSVCTYQRSYLLENLLNLIGE